MTVGAGLDGDRCASDQVTLADEPCRPVIRAGLAIGLRVGPGTALRSAHELGLMLGWPGFACGDGGLLLAFDGPVYGGDVGFELAPPFHRGRRFPFGLGLPLFG